MQLKSFYTEQEPEVVRVQVCDEDGLVAYRVISFENYVKALKGSSWTKPSYNRVGKLPRGFVDATIASNQLFKVVLELPEMIRPVIHHNKQNTEQYMIPYPACMFMMNIEGGYVKGTSIYAIGENEKMLYQFPFPNVHKGGSICWGGVKLPQIGNLKESEIIPEYFFGADNNNDLFSSDFFLKNGEETSSPKSWFSFLGRKELFPAEYLKPLGKREELISKFLGE